MAFSEKEVVRGSLTAEEVFKEVEVKEAIQGQEGWVIIIILVGFVVAESS